MDRVDVDGDGREDLVLWQASGKLDFKTDIYIFLRGADQKLPEQPTQVLHCRGFPIPIGSTKKRSPVHDLNGDGVCELVLLEMKTRIISESGLVETVVSHGLDWALTIRSFHHGAFSRSPDASVPVTGILLSEILGRVADSLFKETSMATAASIFWSDARTLNGIFSAARRTDAGSRRNPR